MALNRGFDIERRIMSGAFSEIVFAKRIAASSRRDFKRAIDSGESSFGIFHSVVRFEAGRFHFQPPPWLRYTEGMSKPTKKRRLPDPNVTAFLFVQKLTGQPPKVEKEEKGKGKPKRKTKGNAD